jgi:hypothetical protein
VHWLIERSLALSAGQLRASLGSAQAERDVEFA